MTLKEGHNMEGHLTAGEYFGRYWNAGDIKKGHISEAVYNKFTCWKVSERGRI